MWEALCTKVHRLGSDAFAICRWLVGSLGPQVQTSRSRTKWNTLSSGTPSCTSMARFVAFITVYPCLFYISLFEFCGMFLVFSCR